MPFLIYRLSKSRNTQSFSACRSRKFCSDYRTYCTYSNHTSQQKFIVDKNTSNAKIGEGKSALSL